VFELKELLLVTGHTKGCSPREGNQTEWASLQTLFYCMCSKSGGMPSAWQDITVPLHLSAWWYNIILYNYMRWDTLLRTPSQRCLTLLAKRKI